MTIKRYIYNLSKAMRETSDATEKEALGIKMRYAVAYNQGEAALNSFRDRYIEAEMKKKYTLGAEIALTNDKDIKPNEYAAYQAYRVACKTKVDADIAMLEAEISAALN